MPVSGAFSCSADLTAPGPEPGCDTWENPVVTSNARHIRQLYKRFGPGQERPCALGVAAPASAGEGEHSDDGRPSQATQWAGQRPEAARGLCRQAVFRLLNAVHLQISMCTTS